jgi:hypothetical protein
VWRTREVGLSRFAESNDASRGKSAAVTSASPSIESRMSVEIFVNILIVAAHDLLDYLLVACKSVNIVKN